MTEQRAPFDPSDPFDACAEMIRREISSVGLRALETTIYRELDATKQIECFLAGALPGVIGVVFSHVKPEGHDKIMEYITACLPIAREITDSIVANDASPK